MVDKILRLMLDLHSLAEIAEELQTSSSNVEMILCRLERGGYVRRINFGDGQCHDKKCAGCILAARCHLSSWELTEKGRKACQI